MNKLEREQRDFDSRLVERAPWRFVARYPYAFPGGYDVVAIASDGGALCSKCVRDNYVEVAHDSRRKWRTGWDVVGIMLGCDTDDSLTCDHCGTELSAYFEGE